LSGVTKTKIINIHPSLLPSFPGPQAYRQAYEQGVKIIGVTSHFVTMRLDEGPSLPRAVSTSGRIGGLKEIVGAGQRLETKVLLKALKLYWQSGSTFIGNRKTSVGLGSSARPFPDRHDAFHLVDQPLAGRKRFAAMRSTTSTQSDGSFTSTIPIRCTAGPTRSASAFSHLIEQPVELMFGHAEKGFVFRWR